jgi:hypothetical protein
MIAEVSQRAEIERIRTLNRKRRELIAKHRAAGSNEGEAMLQASEDLEAMGLVARRPRIVAVPVKVAPDGVRVFDIPDIYLDVGLFKDIAEAIALPGTPVRTGTGTYLKYNDDDIGLRLKAWRHDGNDRFVVTTRGKMFLLEVR